MTGFIDLPPQCLPLFRGEPALASALRLSAICAIAFRALLCARIRLGRLLLGGGIAWVAAKVALLRRLPSPVRYHCLPPAVALLRHPACGAS